jgi:hypothetical protein
MVHENTPHDTCDPPQAEWCNGYYPEVPVVLLQYFTKGFIIAISERR